MPKFGNNVETIITVFPLWGNFLILQVERERRKKGKALMYFTHYFITFAVLIYKVIK